MAQPATARQIIHTYNKGDYVLLCTPVETELGPGKRTQGIRVESYHKCSKTELPSVEQRYLLKSAVVCDTSSLNPAQLKLLQAEIERIKMQKCRCSLSNHLLKVAR